MTEAGKWFCDTCGEVIEGVDDGRVEWITYRGKEGKIEARDFRLVHHGTGCQFSEAEERKKDGGSLSDLPLKHFLGPDGLMHLLSRIAKGEIPLNQILEMIKRLHVLEYEKVRRHIPRALRKGIIEQELPLGFYTQSQIKAIIDKKWPDNIAALRTEKPKLNLNKGFSEDDLRQLLASCDDLEGHHIMWVDNDGNLDITLLSPEMTPAGWAESMEGKVKFRYETYVSGNEYVGFEAARDDKYVKKLFEELNTYWKEGKTGYVDY